MFKNHLEIAKLFRYDPDKKEYFYHYKARWTAGGEVITEDEWIAVSEEVFYDLRRDAEKEYKRQDRSSRCRNEDGTRCMEDCKNCPKNKTSRDGSSLSLEQLMEVGAAIGDSFLIESYIEDQELKETLWKAVNSLDEKKRRIIILYAQGMSEREIGKAIGMSQRGVGYQKKQAFAQIAEMMKNSR